MGISSCLAGLIIIFKFFFYVKISLKAPFFTAFLTLFTALLLPLLVASSLNGGWRSVHMNGS